MNTALALLPYYSDPVYQHSHSVFAAQLPHATIQGVASIDQARNILLASALKHETADVFVFIDGDIEFSLNDWNMIVEAARETKGIVGAVYSTKQLGGKMVGEPKDFDQSVSFYDKGKLYEANALGMGFTSMHRSAIEKMCEAYPAIEMTARPGRLASPLFMSLVHEGRCWGEDFAFSIRARACGVPMFLDTRQKLKHWGRLGFRIEELGISSPEVSSVTVATLKKEGAKP
jgi:hypothetical protein